MPLNCQTDEILDSFLSLSRFTSLVRWRYVKDSEGDVGEPAYRPIRAADSPQSVVLRDGPTGSVLPTTDWIWTGASDGTITVGWILRNYGYDPGEEWYPWAGYVTTDNPPYVEITGLDTTVDLELVWFDDQRGILLDRVDLGQTGEFVGYAPETEGAGNGFGKSIAFLIQPEGFTPEKVFEPLPNEPISLILVDKYVGTPAIDLPNGWTEEWSDVIKNQMHKFIVKTKPAIADPSQYMFVWSFPNHDPPIESDPVDGGQYVGQVHYARNHAPNNPGHYQVKVEIVNKQSNMTVSADIIHLNVWDTGPKPVPSPRSLDFNNYEILPYAGAQDTTGVVTIENDGATLHLVGNLWKKIDFPYTVTADTVLEFDFKSGVEGEIHAIGFDVSDTPASNYVFQLYGTQIGWGRPNYNDYTPEDDWKHYVIPVGQFYTGDMLYMVFIMDHDVQEPMGETLFSNVEVYEDN